MHLKKFVTTVLFTILCVNAFSQKLIEYQSGMGTRNSKNPDVWILYKSVRATHEGMVLNSDSAHFDTRKNNFTAFRNIVIELSDTTTIFGDKLFYNGNTRIIEIWGEEVLLIDGATSLLTTYLSYDRNTSTARYTKHGHAVNKNNTLDSKNGLYYSNINEFFICDSVVLSDSLSVIYTDTMTYNTNTNTAVFYGPTYIYSDSTVIYSESGSYNTSDGHSSSNRQSSVKSGSQVLRCDTLDYYRRQKFGIARNNVNIWDSANNVICTGHYAETDEYRHYNFVTEKATAMFVNDRKDTLFMHSDTIYAHTDDTNSFKDVSAFHHVKLFREDFQGLCDSAFYNINDSLITLYRNPIAWYGKEQCTADTIMIKLDTSGAKNIRLRTNAFIIESVDTLQYNQIKGKNSIVYFRDGEPTYADVLGNAQSVYYLTEDQPDSSQALIGVNVGIGSDMRIYFKDRKPYRVATYIKPDMQCYPVLQLPDDKKFIKGFRWLGDLRPAKKDDIYTWHEIPSANDEKK